MLTFKRSYFYLTVLVLGIEICIGLFVRDRFIRPYIGDVLVVILLYTLVRTFLRVTILQAILSVLLFACLTELLQFLHLADRLGLDRNSVAGIIIGNTFSWTDILCYLAGAVVILLAETYLRRRRGKA